MGGVIKNENENEIEIELISLVRVFSLRTRIKKV